MQCKVNVNVHVTGKMKMVCDVCVCMPACSMYACMSACQCLSVCVSVYIDGECVLLSACPPGCLSCPVLSCPFLSCPVQSCPVLSCAVLYCHVFLHTWCTWTLPLRLLASGLLIRDSGIGLVHMGPLMINGTWSIVTASPYFLCSLTSLKLGVP